MSGKPMDAEKALAALHAEVCDSWSYHGCKGDSAQGVHALINALARAVFEEADATWPERHDSRNPKPPPKWLTETSR